MYRILFALLMVALLSLSSQTIHAANNSKQKSGGNCTSCRIICEKTLAYLLKKGGSHADPKRIQLMRDCINVCNSNAKSSHSHKDGTLTDTCADICAKCAKSCEDLGDDSLKDCIAMCKKCADSCTTDKTN